MNMTANSSSLVSLCENYLAAEESVLRRLVEAIRGVRQAALEGDAEQMEQAAAALHAQAMSDADWVRQRRAFSQAVGGRLGLPPEKVTIRKLLDQLPPAEAAALRPAHRRLTELAGELDRLNRSNHALFHYNIDFFQQFFQKATGGSRGSGAYGRTGKALASPSGCLIQGRG